MNRNRILAAGATFALTMAGVEAQVGGPFWKPYSASGTIQERGSGARYVKADGIETFTMSGNDERCEMRVQDDYRSGIRQFEGYVRIQAGSGGASGNAGPSAGACIHQVFKFLMIVVYNRNGGELYQHSYMDLKTRNAYGRWIRINTIHDVGRRRAEVWIDGDLKVSFGAGTSGGPNGFYHKYGVYNGSGSNPFIEWRDIKYWEGSTTPISNSVLSHPDKGGRARIAWLSTKRPFDAAGLSLRDLTGRWARITGMDGAAGLYVMPAAAPQGKDDALIQE